MPAPQSGRAAKVRAIACPETQPPLVVDVELPCDECGGSGFDPGGIDPWGPEPCPVCHGAGTQKITKNYLAEAFRIIGNPHCAVPVERAHLVAIVQYCRQLISAVVALPEVPKQAQVQARLQSLQIDSRAKVAHTHAVTHIKRRKRDVDIRPQRT